MPGLPVGAGEGPFVLVTPLVDAHHEEPEWGLIGRCVSVALEPAVEPGSFQGIHVDHGSGAEVDVAGARGGREIAAQVVGPGAHDEPGLPRGSRSAVQAQAIELIEGLRGVEVVPAAHDECGDGDVVPVRSGVDGCPVGIRGRQVQPVTPEVQVASGEARDVFQRKHAADFGPVLEVNGLRSASGHAQAPVDEHTKLEGAAGANEAGEVVHADGLRRQAGEAWMRQGRAEPLDRTQVGTTGHADAAVAPGLFGNPGLGVVAVLRLRDEGRPGTVGIPASAHVLDHAGVAGVGQRASLADVVVRCVVVGGADQDGGDSRVGGFARATRVINVGREMDAVAHPDSAVDLNLDGAGGGHVWVRGALTSP